MKRSHIIASAMAAVASIGSQAALADSKPNHQSVERGKYLISTSGCNDCHTPGYAQADGAIPTNQWLTGSPIGFQGPWGTTYPSNLRLVINSMSENEWIKAARSPMRPPMPWFNTREMSNNDLSAIYHFVKSLGPAGQPAPQYAPPGQAVNTPYFEFMPKNLPVTIKTSGITK